jgi:hypothetical protein
MSANPNTQVLHNPVGRNDGSGWHRLHSEREDICEALLKEFRPGLATQVGFAGMSKANATGTENFRRELLHARLRKIDDPRSIDGRFVRQL